MKLLYIINIILLLTLFCNSNTNPKIRQSALAGKWYSADSSELSSTIDKLLADSDRKKTTRPILLIQPHAGYIYSGKIAAAGYNLIKKYIPDIIIIIAPSHHGYFKGCSILDVDYYNTPLGNIKIDKKITRKLLKEPLFQTKIRVHKQEHSIEIHLPFLQRIYNDRLKHDIRIVPILVGNINRDDAVTISSSIMKAIKEKSHPLFIISSDFTHYGKKFAYLPFKRNNVNTLKKKIKELDFGAINHILNNDRIKFCDYIRKTGITICGRNAIKIALALPINILKSELIAYDTSGNITGNFSNTVSYASISFSGSIIRINNQTQKEKNMQFTLSDEEKKYLLDLARNNIESLLHNKNLKIDQDAISHNCRAKTGVFVTLKKKGNLRGCIGYVMGVKPLYDAVIDNSRNAAFKDPRFPPLEKNELTDIKIEISALTIPELIKSEDEIKVGRDGLIIEQGYKKGLLLPQVPVEWRWDRDEYLIQTCRKAGLPDYAWKHGAKIYRFQAIVFSEDDI